METVMKKMMLQQLLLKQKRDALIREQANLIANKLILEFEVNEGTKLAYFLTVPLRYSPMSRPNNHKIKIELG